MKWMQQEVKRDSIEPIGLTFALNLTKLDRTPHLSLLSFDFLCLIWFVASDPATFGLLLVFNWKLLSFQRIVERLYNIFGLFQVSNLNLVFHWKLLGFRVFERDNQYFHNFISFQVSDHNFQLIFKVYSTYQQLSLFLYLVRFPGVLFIFCILWCLFLTLVYRNTSFSRT